MRIVIFFFTNRLAFLLENILKLTIEAFTASTGGDRQKSIL